METKIQLILAKIPDSNDIVNKIKKAYKSGDINQEDEFINVQAGITHVTKRVDEIEDLRKLWAKHKDALTTLVTRKNVPLNSRPSDISGIKFYQFINTNMGTPCYQLITLNGWPTTEEWKSWDAWWNTEMHKMNQHEDHLGIKTPTARWPMQVAHTTAMIMQAIYDIHIAAATNIMQIQIEPLIWKIAFIKNALMELFIIPKTNEKGWIANLWNINDKLLKETTSVWELQKIIASILPAKIQEEHILYVSTPAKDLIPFRDHKISVATEKLPVPKIRTLPENYRLKWEQDPGPDDKPSSSKQKVSKKENSEKEISEKQPKRKRKTITRTPPTLKQEKKRKSKKDSSSESSENESEVIDSSSDDTEKNKAIIVGSSSSEDEDFD